MQAPSRNPAAPRLVLASASPRRRELVSLLGLPFEVVPSRYEEPPAPREPVVLPDLVIALATHKAREVASRTQDGLVLGADTEVSIDEGIGVPLGKPVDDADARRMLRQLSGRTHRVYTGVTLIPVRDGTPLAPVSSAVCTRVRFRELNDTMIADYVATAEPLDKAGAYGAQGYAAPFIESLDGDFYNVVGLPVCEVGRLLERVGVEWWHHREQLRFNPG